MIINNTLQAITGAYTKNATSSVKSANKAVASTAEKKDEIVLSQEAQNFRSTLQQLKNMSDDVRTDKVDFYTQQIGAGTYAVNADAVAGKMLQMRY